MVVVNDFCLVGVDGVEGYLVGHALAEVFQLGCQELLQVFVGIDVQGSGASQESERGNQSHQSEAMVTMEM